MPLFTQYASAERASQAEIERDAQLFEQFPHVATFLDAMPAICLMLNPQRQVIFANQALYEQLGVPRTLVYGMRPGELLNCTNAYINPGGCGTSEFCRTCGAVNSILASLDGEQAASECRITQRDGDALDLRVQATPFEWNGGRYVIFALEDIGAEKRRRALERIFFHDVLNTAGTIVGYMSAFHDGVLDPEPQYTEALYRQSRRLVAEIEAQRDLVAAEQHDLVASPRVVDALQVLTDIQEVSRFFRQAQDRTIELAPGAQGGRLVTDDRLLGRVLGNMIKNALEACNDGETVTLDCRVEDGFVTYSVHNPAVMPEDVRLQVFRRSFSPKGAGRGLGTYSMKLLSERYLGGTVWFETAPGAGTTFYARYPVEWGQNR